MSPQELCPRAAGQALNVTMSQHRQPGAGALQRPGAAPASAGHRSARGAEGALAREEVPKDRDSIELQDAKMSPSVLFAF